MIDTVREFEDAAEAFLVGNDSITVVATGHSARPEERCPLWSEIGKQGWFRILVPDHAGGLGLDLSHLGAVFRAAGAKLVRGPMLDHAVSLPLLLSDANPDLRGQMERALDGDEVIVMARDLEIPFGEAGDGIVLDSERLSGAAPLVEFAAWADAFVVIADERGESVIALVPASAAIVTPRRSLDPCVSYGRVSFEGANVTADRILARGSRARALLEAVDDVQRLMIAAEMAGVVATLTAMSLDYAKMRHQFGRAIGTFQAIQHMLATLATRSSTLTSLSQVALADVDSDPLRRSELAMVAKAHANEVGRYAAEESLQIFGGIGFTEELPLHLFYRRALTNEGRLGEAPDLHQQLGEQLLGGLLVH